MCNLLLKQTHYKQAINHFWQLLVLCEYFELTYVTVSSILEQRNPCAFAYKAELCGDATPEGFHWSCCGYVLGTVHFGMKTDFIQALER